MIYIVGWSALYLTAITSNLLRYKGLLINSIGILFLSLLIILRGSSGTDTATYENIIARIDSESVGAIVEPGFSLLSILLFDFVDDNKLAVRGIALVFSILFFLNAWKSNRDERYFWLLFFAPAFYYVYGMNSIRIGLSAVLYCSALYCLSRRFHIRGWLLLIMSVSMHYSMLLGVAYVVVLFNTRPARVVVLALPIILGALPIVLPHIYKKMEVYARFESPSIYSGLSQVILLALILAAILLSRIPRRSKFMLTSLAVCSTIAFYGITLYSYAGLRLLSLAVFIFPACLIYLHTYFCVRASRDTKIILALTGFVAAIFTFRNFINEPDGSSPFLPYEFLIEM